MPFFKVEDFSERSLGKDADAHAIAFVGLRCGPDAEHTRLVYGAENIRILTAPPSPRWSAQ